MHKLYLNSLNIFYHFTNLFMKKIQLNYAFTLIELLVWITIISIIILWTNSLNFNKINHKEKLNLFIYNIKSNFETTRNNALSWKGIWVTLDLPEKWKIEYSTTGSWIISTSTTNDWVSWVIYENIDFQQNFSLSEINCLKLDWSNDWNITWTWIIEFDWINLTLTWASVISDCNEESKKLELTLKYQWEEKKLIFNSLNWLAEIK